MANRSSARISSRKAPKQARSNELVKAILQAAVQVLEEEGAQRFTTARVAERAGVSVGSLYQYFPNKGAILFRLQSDEWRQTSGLLATILSDGSRSPLDRLRSLVHAFLRSECEEAAVRVALGDAAPLYRDAPEAREAKEANDPLIDQFMIELLPNAPTDLRELAGDLIMTTMTTVGKDFSGTARSDAEIEAYADAMADMFSAYLVAKGAGT
ncbi:MULTISPECIES: TetR family transcriptional regulator [Ensifer]|uniref:TetR family transcriptional regulator n=1 Tax=Ensifer TaxID=106591 RepID=UPI000DC28B75|nr:MULTISPECIES: TetR family transcriptional regulator [Ensifer]MBD9556694.1 TetR family transcriptional regulator [Ensifer sp. ENS03]MBD9623716.1 TetR family transcriptional regulator [Ensifer sp. ENS06]MCY1743856.1 TetR family transcriptional regulator [Ensifer sp. SL37]RAS16768.1 TetR family transcriptional regulator [Ensifer adhaerens]